MRIFIIAFVSNFSLFTHAQETELDDAEQSMEIESQDVETEDAQPANEETLTPNSSSEDRFIPTDQISQDSGVSFPINI